MCGRYTRRTPLQNVVDLFSALPEREDIVLTPRYNIAPTQDVAVVRDDGKGRRGIALLRWGLIPSWATDPAIGNRMINARAETVAEKPAYRRVLQTRRCLIPADGFFEWKSEGKQKQPYFFHQPDDRTFAFAGLWDRWRRDDTTIESCTIITAEANAVVGPVHGRMPVIIKTTEYGRWLDPKTDPDAARSLLNAEANDSLVATAVNRRVSSPANDDPECVQPVT